MSRRFRDPVEFREALGIRPFSPAWRATIKAFYGTPLEPDERELFLQLSGGVPERPGVGWNDALFNVGRGGGKDDATKTVCNYEASEGGHEIGAAPGQRLPILVICPLRNQAVGMLRMVAGEAALPLLKRKVASFTRDSVEYKSGLVVQVQTCDDVAVVGDTVPLAVLNEWALAPGDEAAASDRVILSNLLPALRQIQGTPPHRLIIITSSYIREGHAWETFRDNFGKADSDVLVVQGATEVFNPNIDRAWLASQIKKLGRTAYDMHHNCVWAGAITDGWFGTDVVDGCIDHDRDGDDEPDALEDTRYFAALDQAFRGDRFALAIAHREQEDENSPARNILDGVWHWSAPRGGVLSVQDTVRECAAIIQRFGALTWADQFAFDPLKEIFYQHGVSLDEAPWTAQTKPARFSTVRNAMIDKEVSLPNDLELIREFHSIRGKLLRSGGERIEGHGGHDDLVHAAVLALFMTMSHEPDMRGGGHDISLGSTYSDRAGADPRFMGNDHDGSVLQGEFFWKGGERKFRLTR